MPGIKSDLFRDMMIGGARRLCENRGAVDDLNVFPVPDGDTGTNLCRTLEKMEAALAGSFATPKAVAESAARGALMGARGNSGVIISQMLKGLFEGLEDTPEMGPISFANGLVEAADRAYQAVIKPVEGTILTVMKEAATAGALTISGPETPVADVLDAALLQARHTLDRTPEMLEKLREAGVVDAGGAGLVYFLEGMLLTLQGEITVGPPRAEIEKAPVRAEDLEYRYCTEVVISAAENFADRLKELIGENSDSLIVVGDNDAVKVHVHVNDPGKVLSLALEGGELLDVKVDNMSRQHRELTVAGGAAKAGSGKPGGGVSVVAVVNGRGFREIFESLGVEGFVDGGQSMNPSTEELLDAVESVSSDEVIILPNNKNIILAAETAAGMSGKKVYIIPTKNIPQGFSAMMEFEGEKPVAERVEVMKSAVENISVAEITRAVRDAVCGGREVRQGDFISVVNGDVKIVAETAADALRETISAFDEAGCEIITIYRGQGIDMDETDGIIEDIREKYPRMEFETHYGGQPEYHYIISGE